MWFSTLHTLALGSCICFEAKGIRAAWCMHSTIMTDFALQSVSFLNTLCSIFVCLAAYSTGLRGWSIQMASAHADCIWSIKQVYNCICALTIYVTTIFTIVETCMGERRDCNHVKVTSSLNTIILNKPKTDSFWQWHNRTPSVCLEMKSKWQKRATWSGASVFKPSEWLRRISQ